MSTTTKNVYFYVPNAIGYARVAFTFLMCCTARSNYILTGWFYSIAAILDLFDGMAARRFKQSTAFGAVLDMVTDRFSNACILGVLYAQYENFGFIFLWMLALDLTSHWYQVYSTLYCEEKHHKNAASKFRLLDIYYKTPYVLFVMVLGSETAYVCLYVANFANELSSVMYSIYLVAYYISLPILALKIFINVVQLMNATEKINEKEKSLNQKK